MNINEQNFIKEIRKRNTRALDYIVDNYSNLVFKIVVSVLNSSFYFQHVEECANDVFWSVWNNIDSFDEDKGEFKHWIAAISKYKAIDYKRKLFKESIVEDIDDYYNLCDEISTENTVLSKENRKEVLNAINNIKDENGERINCKDHCDIRRNEENPNEFEIDFEALDKNKKYSICTNDLSNVEFGEDLKFKIELK